VPAIDPKSLGVGGSPFLAVRRAQRGLVSADAARHSFSSPLLTQLGLDAALGAVAGPVTDAAYGGKIVSAAAPDAGTPPSSLDWRNRWGQKWITMTRDQNPCGIGWIAYGECRIDDFARNGVRNTNPDPWTKRRLHNGNLFESRNGALHRNLEVAGSNGSRVQHRWREGGPPFNWGTSAAFATDAAVSDLSIDPSPKRRTIST